MTRKLLCSLVAFAFVVPAAVLIGQEAKKEAATSPAREMLETAREAYMLQLQMRRAGEIRDVGHEWSERLLEAELLVAKTADERRSAIQQHLERTIEMLELQKRLAESLEVSKLEVLEWQYRVAAAKQMYAEAK